MADVFDAQKAEEEKRIREGTSDYISLKFIPASAAKVESLWSKVGALCGTPRLGMSPIMVETIMFLKENRVSGG